MTKKIQYPILIFGLPLLLLAFLILLVRSSIFQQNPAELSFAITLDLLVTIPILYFLIIRKREIPKITVVSVFIVCTAIASFVIPIEHQAFLSQVKTFAIPFVELSVLTFVILKTRAIIRSFRDSDTEQLEFFDALSLACSKILPGRVGKLFATEISVIYYSFSKFVKKEIQPNEYTYFEKSGIKTVVYALIFIILIETFAVHLLVHKWYPTVALVLSLFSLYTCLQFFSLSKSMDRRLISIDYENQILHLRYGFFNQTSFPFADVKSIELNRRTLPEDSSIVPFSALGGFDSHNIIIHLKQEHTLHRIYGIENKFQALALYVDKKEEFVDKVRELMGE